MSSYSGRAAGSFGAVGGELSFNWIPDPEVVASELLEIAGHLENLEAPLALARQIAIDDVRGRFESKTAPDGSHWQAWSDSYTPDAEANNLDGILVRSGDLKAAATADGAYVVDGHSLFFDTSGLPDYGYWNEQGAERGSGISSDEMAAFIRKAGFEPTAESLAGTGGPNRLPARPFMGLSFEAELQVVEVFDQWFEGAIALGTSPKGKLFGRHSLRGSGGRFIPRG